MASGSSATWMPKKRVRVVTLRPHESGPLDGARNAPQSSDSRAIISLVLDAVPLTMQRCVRNASPFVASVSSDAPPRTNAPKETAGSAGPGAHPVEFAAEQLPRSADSRPARVSAESTFIVPR